MKYFSSAQIQESLRNLRRFNPFYSITFLVLKKENVPIGNTKRFILDTETRAFLIKFFRVHPKSNNFFRVMKQTAYSKDWVESNYASTGLQAVNTQTFRDAILHERNDNTWGWTNDYVQRLAEKLPHGSVRIPLYDLAVWLYRDQGWDDQVRQDEIIKRFVTEYRLTQEEIENLFNIDTIPWLPEEHVFQEIPVRWEEILAPFSRPNDVPAEASGILTYLETQNIGPVSSLVFQPARRLNLITGDNGLGKTFLLDLAWWALTEDWAERPATPTQISPSHRPLIKFAVGGPADSRPVRAEYSYQTGGWEVPEPRPAMSGLVVYARVDGSFAVWDPANRALAGPDRGLGLWPGMKFTRDEVWDGKPQQIEGLIRDWIKWQQRPDLYPAFETFQAVLNLVSPPEIGNMVAGDPIRIPNDPREIPTLIHPYGSVPILFESAGIRRILTLAYLLVWVWEEHKVQARQQGRPEERQMVVLIDEAESHLHPKWQRVILSALLGVAHHLHEEMAIQWIIASHSPLVLASAEAAWDTDTDRLFHINMSVAGNVTFENLMFEKRGTIDSWLSSDVFELPLPGSFEREDAIQEAVHIQQQENPSVADIEKVAIRLNKLLPAEDPFWVRWIFFAESYGVSP